MFPAHLAFRIVNFRFSSRLATDGPIRASQFAGEKTGAAAQRGLKMGHFAAPFGGPETNRAA